MTTRGAGPAPAAGEGGSVFIESLVAAALAAVIVAAMFQTLSASAARHRDLADRRAALALARSELAQSGVSLPAGAGAEGVADGFDWRLESAPVSDGAGSSQAGALYAVTVSVRRHGEAAPLVTLASRRLAPAG